MPDQRTVVENTGLLMKSIQRNITRLLNARELHALSQQTDWQIHRTLAYNQFSAEFRRVLEQMIHVLPECELYCQLSQK